MTRLTFGDLVIEAWRSISRAPGRAFFTSMGTLLGTAAFVATLGITATLSHQVSDAFDERRATTVTVGLDDSALAEAPVGGVVPDWADPVALQRAARLSGTAAAGTLASSVNVSVNRIAASAGDVRIDVHGVDAGTLLAIAPHLGAGRLPDSGHFERRDKVVLLSAQAAQRLQIHVTGAGIRIAGEHFTVIGFYDDVLRGPDTLKGMIVPLGSTPGVWREQPPSFTVLLQTLPGAATQIGSQIAMALDPGGTSALKVVAPPDLGSLRHEVEASVTRMSLLVSAVTLAIGAVSIGNGTMSAIALRTAEIGLRRALGARRRHVFAQLLGETTFLGLAGGLLGALLGVLATLVVSLANGWVPVLDLGTVGMAVGAGALAGAVAGYWPARVAARIEPSVALAR